MTNEELAELEHLLEKRSTCPCECCAFLRNAAPALLAAAREAVRLRAWYAALDEALVVDWCWKPEHDADPRKALNDLICTNQQIALDPRVSKEAADLRDQALEDAAKDCDYEAESLEREAKHLHEKGDRGTSDVCRQKARTARQLGATIRALKGAKP